VGFKRRRLSCLFFLLGGHNGISWSVKLRNDRFVSRRSATNKPKT
jgi:hypothetical protein